MAKNEKADTMTEGSASQRSVLERFARLAMDNLRWQDEVPVRLPLSVEDVNATVDLAIADQGLTMEAVFEKLERLCQITPLTTGPAFFNQLFSGRDAMAMAGEMTAALHNISLYTYKLAGPHVLIEQELIAHMGSFAGFSQTDGMFTPGGSLSNLAAMLAARNHAVQDSRETGGDGQTLRIYTSRTSHYSVRKAAGIIGIGRQNVVAVEVDADGRMSVDSLAEAIDLDRKRGFLPVMINATCGTTVMGAFDPLPAIAAVAKREGIWLHADGAWGGSVLLSPRHRHLMDGIQEVDSFTWDAHKMMGVPLTCSVVLSRHGNLWTRNFNEEASYLFQGDSDALNPGTRSLQCGRRNDQLKLWTAWQYHGDHGYAARIDRLFDLASHASRCVEAHPDLRLVVEPQSLNICFEVVGVCSAAICDQLNVQGLAMIGHGEVQGREVIRLVTANPEHQPCDLDRLIDLVVTVARSLPRS